ncbi:MAG: DUF1015 domain-containing protein [bacterium]
MADVRPFPALRYNPAKVNDLNAVITQPYDKITPRMQDDYLAKHPYNFVRLILPGGENPYRSSARTCEEWRKEGVLIEEERPAFYVLEEEFKIDSRVLKRRGFIGAIRVEEFERGTVLPHEFTHSGPKADRLNLLRTTEKDYEQIFLLYPDEKGAIDRLLQITYEPLMQAIDEYGVVHRLWRIMEVAQLNELQRLLKDRVMLIADGHHRYETALTYRQEMEKKGFVPDNAALRFKTAAFFKITDPGLVILPTHRLLKGTGIKPEEGLKRLSQFFTVRQVADERGRAELEGHSDRHAFVIYFGKGSSYLLILKPLNIELDNLKDRSPEYRGLDVALAHSLVIEQVFGIKPEQIEVRVAYERYWDEAISRVDSGEFELALFLNPTRPEQVQALAKKMERMPQKSTDFYPKLISGMVFMDVAGGKLLIDRPSATQF